MKNKIVVIDDSAIIRTTLNEQIKRKFDVDIYLYDTTEDFIKNPINADVMILDYDFANRSGEHTMTGYEFLIKSAAYNLITCPIIFLTAHREEDLLLKLMSAPSVYCIFEKPYETRLFLSTIEQLLQNKKRLRK